MISRWRTDHLVRNAALIATTTLTIASAGFIFWIIAAHRFSADLIGRAATVTSLTPLVATLASLGLAPAITRHIASHPTPSRLVWRSYSVAATTGLVVGSMIGAFHPSLADHRSLAVPGVAIAAAALAANMLSTATIVASRRAGLLIFESLAATVAKLTAISIFPRTQLGLLAAVLAGILASATTSGLVTRFALHLNSTGARQLHGIYRFAFTNWISSGVSLVPLALLPSFVLARSSSAAAASTAIAALFLPLLNLPASTVARSLFAEASAHPEQTPRLAKRALKVMLLLSGSATILVLVLAPVFLNLFGKSYSDSASTLLRLLALSAFVAVGNYLADTILSIRGDNVGYFLVSLLGTIFVGAGAWFASPHGPVAIGIGWVAAQLAYSVVAWTTITLRKKTFTHHH